VRVQVVDHLVDRPSARRPVDASQFLDRLQAHLDSLAGLRPTGTATWLTPLTRVVTMDIGAPGTILYVTARRETD
jgi:hypothetical protein